MKSGATSQVLSSLLDSRRYDSRLRPNYAGKNCHQTSTLFIDNSKIIRRTRLARAYNTFVRKYEMIILD